MCYVYREKISVSVCVCVKFILLTLLTIVWIISFCFASHERNICFNVFSFQHFQIIKLYANDRANGREQKTTLKNYKYVFEHFFSFIFSLSHHISFSSCLYLRFMYMYMRKPFPIIIITVSLLVQSTRNIVI